MSDPLVYFRLRDGSTSAERIRGVYAGLKEPEPYGSGIIEYQSMKGTDALLGVVYGLKPTGGWVKA